jgi:hypothetical protein
VLSEKQPIISDKQLIPTTNTRNPFFIGFIQARINLNAGTDPWVG